MYVFVYPIKPYCRLHSAMFSHSCLVPSHQQEIMLKTCQESIKIFRMQNRAICIETVLLHTDLLRLVWPSDPGHQSFTSATLPPWQENARNVRPERLWMFATGTVVSYEVSIGNFTPFPSVFVCRSVYASSVCFVSVVCVIGACPNGRVVKGVATDGLLSITTSRVRISTGACEKVAIDLGFGGVLSSYCGFYLIYNRIVTT